MDINKIPANVDKAEFLTILKNNKEEAFKYMFSKVFLWNFIRKNIYF